MNRETIKSDKIPTTCEFCGKTEHEAKFDKSEYVWGECDDCYECRTALRSGYARMDEMKRAGIW